MNPEAPGGGAESPPVLHVVLTCTKRKRYPPAPDLELHRLPGGTPEERAERWIERVEACTAGRVPVETLYVGDHWHVGRSLDQAGAGAGVRVVHWVCSAGYGLLALDACVPPYSATFSGAHPDSVIRGVAGATPGEATRRWWHALSRWAGPAPGAPRTLREVAEGDPSAAMWVIASEPYLRAMEADVLGAAAVLEEPERLSVFSAGARMAGAFAPFLLVYGLRLRSALGGAAMSLNVRAARHVLASGVGLERTAIARELARFMGTAPGPDPLRRPPLADDEVKAFIRAALAADPRVRCSPLLRRLRDVEGRACEQKRFGRLYAEVRDGG